MIQGQFLSELERHSEAAVHYMRAAELAPQEYEAVVNAATALRQANRKSEAEKYYRQAVQLRPEVRKSISRCSFTSLLTVLFGLKIKSFTVGNFLLFFFIIAA